MHQLPVAFDDAAVDHDRVDIRRRRRLHDRCLDLREWRDVKVGRADQNNVGALAGRQRSGDVRPIRARARR